jgi:hypothetical protein
MTVVASNEERLAVLKHHGIMRTTTTLSLNETVVRQFIWD